jgi:hypothetical protein
VDSGRTEAVKRLIDDLNQLRLEVGNPSLGRLEQLSGGQLSKTTLDDHLSNRRVRLPPWHLVATYVTACQHAAAATGLDVERLGTLKDWHGRYLAAVTGDANARCPIGREAIIVKRDDSQVGQDPTSPSKPTTRLMPSAKSPFATGQQPDNLNQPTLSESTRILKDWPPVLNKPAVDSSDDELQISAQGAGKWLVRWLPPKPPTSESASRLSGLEDSTESLSSSHDVGPEDLTDLTLSLAADTALLLVKRGPYAGSQFVLNQDRTTIGRDPASDVFLDDATISRKHSVIYRRDGHFKVRDAGSLNGTYVNRQRTAEELLVSGNELQVGVFRFLFLQSY